MVWGCIVPTVKILTPSSERFYLWNKYLYCQSLKFFTTTGAAPDFVIKSRFEDKKVTLSFCIPTSRADSLDMPAQDYAVCSISVVEIGEWRWNDSFMLEWRQCCMYGGAKSCLPPLSQILRLIFLPCLCFNFTSSYLVKLFTSRHSRQVCSDKFCSLHVGRQ